VLLSRRGSLGVKESGLKQSTKPEKLKFILIDKIRGRRLSDISSLSGVEAKRATQQSMGTSAKIEEYSQNIIYIRD
jgi:hypothetical protein